MHNPIRITLVGGGVASFVTGIELRDRFPEAEITLLSAADENTIGGQLASWDEKGYPIEHGLHALFGFYENILPILKRVGAYENFTRSRKHTFVYEKGKLHRFHLNTWLATYKGFTQFEKLKLAAFLPKLTEIIAGVELNGYGVLDKYDSYDLREFGRLHGIPESILQSNFFRQFYDPAFNGPQKFSAKVGIESLYKIFAKPWHYYFNHPSRESLVDPLRRYFLNECGGKLLLGQKLLRVKMDDSGSKIRRLEIQELGSGKVYSVEADEYVLALGLEDFKAVDFGPVASQHSYFQNIHRLETVSSVAIQAWFKEDPVPPGLDSLVGGLPEPFSILCPISRVRSVGVGAQRLPYEITATGPEAGFENIDDQELIHQFLKTLQICGFKIPTRSEDMHVALRRNRDPFHRYLLTRPGDLAFRPKHQSPIHNLCLAGAWVRNSFSLPCVDSAAESGKKVAEIILQRRRAISENRKLTVFSGMPRVSPLVMPPPYRFPKSQGAFFVLNVDPAALKNELPPTLRLARPMSNKLVMAVVQHEGVCGDHDPSGASYSYNEILLAAVVHAKERSSVGGYGLYPIYLYVDDDAAMAAGREVYGFPKKMAQIEVKDQAFSVTRLGRTPSSGKGPAVPIELMSGQWIGPPSQEKREPQALAVPFQRTLQFLSRGSIRKRATQLLSIPFYNSREFSQPVADPRARVSISELTFVQATDLQIRSVSLLKDAKIKFGSSLNDQIHKLVPAPSLELTADYGAYLEFGFSFGTAQIL